MEKNYTEKLITKYLSFFEQRVYKTNDYYGHDQTCVSMTTAEKQYLLKLSKIDKFFKNMVSTYNRWHEIRINSYIYLFHAMHRDVLSKISEEQMKLRIFFMKNERSLSTNNQEIFKMIFPQHKFLIERFMTIIDEIQKEENRKNMALFEEFVAKNDLIYKHCKITPTIEQKVLKRL